MLKRTVSQVFSIVFLCKINRLAGMLFLVFIFSGNTEKNLRINISRFYF